ncbi:MAG: radical SAM protein [Lachnospiraceae bacterium]|nr:radical SAM protein [Lachnospiraceae bacterium]
MSEDALQQYNEAFRSCRLCPRACGADRSAGKKGFCGATAEMRIARAALHFWEEPCISGTEGSGTIFFSGCGLGCVFCQNHEISGRVRELPGKTVSPGELSEYFFRLKEEGANNINLVTADIYIPSVAEAVRIAKDQGFDLPFVFNTGSYITVESLKILEGLTDIYLPDAKFYSEKTAKRYAAAPDYARVSKAAIAEMVRQCGECVFDEKGMMKRGVIIRHLLLPGRLLEAKLILQELWKAYGDRVWFSLLWQYTPLSSLPDGFPELERRVYQREYKELCDHADKLGIRNAWIQEEGCAEEDFIPDFNLR